MNSDEMIHELITALRQADLYLNSYDTSRPSRVKAETRAIVEEALGHLKAFLESNPSVSAA